MESLSEGLDKALKIGLFDSGVGGLSVFNALTRLPFPRRPEFIYVGDTARCPYGDRKPEEIQQFVAEIVSYLTSHDVDAVVMACNTSAACARQVADTTALAPVFDLIQPTAEYLANAGVKVGVMATASTVRSGAFARAIQKQNPGVEVVQVACPELVPIVEGGRIDHPSTKDVLRRYASALTRERVGAIVLGCTHYPFIAETLQELLPKEIRLVDPAKVLAQSLVRRKLLTLSPEAQAKVKPFASLGRWSEDVGSCSMVVTGPPEVFAQTVQRCLGYIPGTISGITVEELTAKAESMPQVNPTSLPSQTIQGPVL